MSFLAALTMGLLGAGHCIAMCGGISAMLTSATNRDRPITRLLLAYNFGRLFSYAIAGGIAGFTVSLGVKGFGAPIALLQAIAGVFLILLGLQFAKWLHWLNFVEVIGKSLWRYLSPFSQRFLPINSIQQAFGFGMVWGWLPCGLVYTALIWSMTTGNALDGALMMFCFGLGTLPALLASGYSVSFVKHLLTHSFFSVCVGISLILYGFFNLKIAYMTLI